MQINYALELIDQRHKLRSTPYRTVWPCLNFLCCCCLKKRKKNFNMALKRAIRRKLSMTIPKADILLEEDPFLMLGYGMNSYFQVMVQLMVLTALISFVMLPFMGTFSTFTTLAAFPGYDYNQFTLGNIGGADAFCTQATFMPD